MGRLPPADRPGRGVASCPVGGWSQLVGSDDESTRRNPSGDGYWRRPNPILAACRAPATALDDGSDVRRRSMTGVTQPCATAQSRSTLSADRKVVRTLHRSTAQDVGSAPK